MVEKKRSHVAKKPKKNKKNKRAVRSNVTAQQRQKTIDEKPKKRINIAKIFKWTCLIALIIGAIIFCLTTPIFNVKEVVVNGNEQVSSEEIVSLSQIQLNQNTFKNSKSKIIKNVKENAYIENVSVKRILPDKIQITVEERYIKFMVKLLSSYAYINSQGYILEISEETKEVPTIEGTSTPEEEMIAGNRLNEEDLKKLEVVLKMMSNCEENEISQYVTSINIQDESNYIMYLAEKSKTVYLGDNSSLSEKILYVKAIMDAEEGNAGTIFLNGDLNDGFKPYFRKQI